MEKDNPLMRFWEAFRAVPESAQRPISDGKLKGKTDINPVWRLKLLTEQFGPCGLGWHYETIERWTDTINGELIANVRIRLMIHPEGGSAWAPIEGIGGSKIFGFGKGQSCDDEAWKMATTDAISVACKSLGIAADIYYAKDAENTGRWSKYDRPADSAPAPAPRPAVNIRHTPDPAAPAATAQYNATDLDVAQKVATGLTVMPEGINIAPGTFRKYVAGAAINGLTKTGVPVMDAYFAKYDPNQVSRGYFMQCVDYVRKAVNNAKNNK